jgi:hypothetical protein
MEQREITTRNQINSQSRDLLLDTYKSVVVSSREEINYKLIEILEVMF